MGVPLQGHTRAICSVAFSPDSKYIISGSGDKRIQIWNTNTGEPVAIPLVGHTEAVRSVAFSQDGKSIISGSYDNTLRIWDVEMNIKGAPVRFITPNIQFSSNPHHALCDVYSLFENAMDITSDWRDSIQVQEDGWILGPHNRLLLWVPPMYFSGLYHPRTKHVIGMAAMKLDLSNFSHGLLWECCGVWDT